MNDDTIKNFVIQRYADKKRLDRYISKTKDGLSKEEVILIKKYVPKRSSILIVGCGTGREAYGLKKLGFGHVTGVDISPNMIREAKKLVKAIKFYCSDINDFKINKKFDAILYLNNVLEQIPFAEKRKEAIVKAKSLLKKKGIAIFTTHSRFVPGKFGEEWIKNLFLYLLYIFKIRKRNPFDFIDKKNKIYAYYSNPFFVKKILKEIGFSIVEINSKHRIIKNKKPSIFWLFNEPIYYVVRTSE